MKAMILAAGEGTRLRPLTLKNPKVMLPIAGEPILEYTLDLLRFHGITDVAVNLHHLPNAVIDWLGDGSRLGIRVIYSVENPILGTAGALTRLRSFFDDTFVLIYGDVLTDLDISSLVLFHQAKKALATVALFEADDPGACGIVEMDDDCQIVRFVEKPAPGITSSNLANAGIYVLEPSVIDYIPLGTFYDFGFHLFPALLGKGARLYGYVTRGYVIDTGTMENYRRAERDVLGGRFVPKRAASTR